MKYLNTLSLLTVLALGFAACGLSGCSGSSQTDPPPSEAASTSAEQTPQAPAPVADPAAEETTEMPDEPTESAAASTEKATFGAGCFWCVEAVLEQVDGVRDVSSGYMGGAVDNPTYRQICTGSTGHAEVVQVTFDPAVVSYDTLLDWFWRLHDPTTLNRQGADVGTQYRSAIFYHSEAQRAAAEKSLKAAETSGTFVNPIVTEVTEATTYYVAEEYHQDYYRGNKTQGYCRAVIRPKLQKLNLDD